MDSPKLLSYLRDSGGLPERAAQRGAPIGPLTHTQVIALLTYPYITILGPLCVCSLTSDLHDLCHPYMHLLLSTSMS